MWGDTLGLPPVSLQTPECGGRPPGQCVPDEVTALRGSKREGVSLTTGCGGHTQGSSSQLGVFCHVFWGKVVDTDIHRHCFARHALANGPGDAGTRRHPGWSFVSIVKVATWKKQPGTDSLSGRSSYMGIRSRVVGLSSGAALEILGSPVWGWGILGGFRQTLRR